MKSTQFLNETTTAGSVASVSMPFKATQKRTSEDSTNVTTKKSKKKYANSLTEGKMKDLFVDLKLPPNGLSDEDFLKKYNKTKKEMRNLFKNKQEQIKEQKLEEEDLIIVPGQGRRLKSGFVPHGQSRVDHEVEMARSDLFQAHKNSKKIYNLIKDRDESEGLEGWVQEKIIKANDYLNTVREYLEHKTLTKEGMKGAMLGGVAGAVITKTPQGTLSGANIGSEIEDMFKEEITSGGVIAGGGVGEGMAEGSLKEIDYASELDSGSIDPNKLIKSGKVVGNIEGNDVVMLSKGNQTIYMLKVDDNATAFVGFEGENLKNIKNFTQTPGVIRALIGFLVHKKKMKIKISPTEPLTNEGLRWISRLLNDPRGLKIKDHSGNDIDFAQLNQEWQLAKKTGTPSETIITISENTHFGNKLRENEEKRKSDSLLMPFNFYSVRSKKQGMAEGLEKIYSDKKPKLVGLSFGELEKLSESAGNDFKKFDIAIKKNLNLPIWTNTLELYGVYIRKLIEQRKGKVLVENKQSKVEQELFSQLSQRSMGSIDSASVGDKVALLHLTTLNIPEHKVVARLNGFLTPKEIVSIKNLGSFQQLEFADGSRYPEKDDGDIFQQTQGWNMTKLFPLYESASKAYMLYALVGKKLSEELDFQLNVEQGVTEGPVDTVKKGIKHIKRVATGKDLDSRIGQEITKSHQASMTGDNKTAHKHFKRYDKLDKLANKEQGVAEDRYEIVNEIGFSSSLGDLSLSNEEIIKSSKPVGTIGSRKVFLFDAGNDKIYFFANQSKIEALVYLYTDRLMAMKNFSENRGLIYNLFQYIINIKKQKIKLLPIDNLTSNGIDWIIGQIKHPTGFKVTDLNGKSIDAASLYREWKNTHEDGKKGPTGIIISESKNSQEIRENELRLMPMDIFGSTLKKLDQVSENLIDIGNLMKFGKQGVAEGTGVTDYNPPNKGGTRKELLAKYHKTKNPKDAQAARKAGATQKELQGDKKENNSINEMSNDLAKDFADFLKSTGRKYTTGRPPERPQPIEPDLTDEIAKLPMLKQQYQDMVDQYNKRNGDSWRYADREQNLSPFEKENREMWYGPITKLWRKIQELEKAKNEQNLEEDSTNEKTFRVTYYSKKLDKNVTKKMKAENESDIWNKFMLKNIDVVSIEQLEDAK